MKVKELIGTLAGLGMSLQGVTHAQPTLAHQAENTGKQGIESLPPPPNCDVFFKNEAGQWEQGISEYVEKKAACIEVGRQVHQANVDHVKEGQSYVPPLLMVDYKGEKIFINPPQTPTPQTPSEYYPYPVK